MKIWQDIRQGGKNQGRKLMGENIALAKQLEKWEIEISELQETISKLKLLIKTLKGQNEDMRKEKEYLQEKDAYNLRELNEKEI